MGTTLDQIVAARRRSLAEASAKSDRYAVAAASAQYAPRGFARALRLAAERGPAIIAELKKASPSRGLIRAEFEPASLALELAEAGAAALSVLTEEQHFQGSLANLRAASEATSLPCLRKDFIVDVFQIIEARANRADAVLLIVAALTDAELRTLLDTARGLELDALVEVHDERELEHALAVGSNIIGVNNRDLRSFEVKLETALRLAPKIPSNVLRVAESGIRTADDIARLRHAGYDAFLIGEALMKAPRPGDALRALVAKDAAAKVRAR